jgi:hypothetical protein
LMSRRRNVSNCATRHIERFGIRNSAQTGNPQSEQMLTAPHSKAEIAESLSPRSLRPTSPIAVEDRRSLRASGGRRRARRWHGRRMICTVNAGRLIAMPRPESSQIASGLGAFQMCYLYMQPKYPERSLGANTILKTLGYSPRNLLRPLPHGEEPRAARRLEP